MQHLKEADPRPRMAIEVICSVLERIVISVVMLTLGSADRAVMPVSVVVRAGTWSWTVHRTGVMLDVMLNL